jgi:Tfp pilus tip-associated adhesin PilY1
VLALDPFNGGKTSKNIFIDNNQAGYDSFLTTVGIVKNLIAIDSGTNVFLFAGGSSGNVQSIRTISQQETGGAIRGRIAWREVFQ